MNLIANYNQLHESLQILLAHCYTTYEAAVNIVNNNVTIMSVGHFCELQTNNG